ncbi:restriction endonuclease subunit S [Thalassolituus oleivorans]|uniref:restriction endonuclease subunit S n=1 Tax=Thalassolituus oleivorans TaxID=187493 RepID=UPI0023F07D03|nr:restriction endonuclease subunit S [Thalassolituus oleivorans]
MSLYSIAPLNSISEVISGYAFKSTWFGSGSDQVIRISDLVAGEVTLSKAVTFDANKYPVSEKYKIREGDILVALSGATVGKIGIASSEAVGAYLNQRVAIVRGFNPVHSDYLSFILRSSYMERLLPSAEGAAQPNLSPKLLETLLIPCPSPEQQRQIAARLKAQLAEVEIARQAAQVQLSEARLLRTRMLKAFFAELESTPKKRLGEHAPTTSGVTPARDNAAYWQPADVAWVKTGEIDFSPITHVNESISNKALKECSLSLLPPKSVLIAITGEGKTRGRSAVLEVSATTNQHSVAVLPNDIWVAEFLQLWLQASYQDLRDLSEGRGGSRSALTGGHIKDLQVPAPTKSEQRQLVERIQAALTEIDTLEQSSKAALADIEKLPARILAKAFSPQGE